MKIRSVPQVCMIDLACCWAGMLLVFLFFQQLAPVTLSRLCGDSPTLDAMILLSASGMAMGGILAVLIVRGPQMGWRWAAHLGAIATMIAIQPNMLPEAVFLSAPDATLSMTGAMTPTMILGYGLGLLLWRFPYVIRLLSGDVPPDGRVQP